MAAWIAPRHGRRTPGPTRRPQRPRRRQHTDAQRGRQSQVRLQRGGAIAQPDGERPQALDKWIFVGTHRGHIATANSPSYPTPANGKNPYTARDSKVTNAGQRRPIRLCKAGVRGSSPLVSTDSRSGICWPIGPCGDLVRLIKSAVVCKSPQEVRIRRPVPELDTSALTRSATSAWPAFGDWMKARWVKLQPLGHSTMV